ncbi:MAG TPA: hypothetical protein VGM96_19720 [Reyranella sp.]|jgi:hypothetical protein
MGQAASPRRHEFGLGANLALLLLSVLVGLATMELAYRAWRDPRLLIDWPNFIEQNRHPPESARYDEVLGFVLDRNVRGADENTDAGGFRVTPPLPAGAPVGRPIVAVGDSFAYGMGVKDNETWPAYLQQQTGWRTINAGAKGYGFDQSVLHAERLAHEVEPSVIVLSFITDDLRRSELSRVWNLPKPYFELVDGEPVLRNVPVPHGDRDVLTFWQRALGWSVLAERFWPALQAIQDETFGRRERALPEGSGEAVACALTRQLAAIGLPVLVVAQYDSRPWSDPAQDRGDQHRQALRILACAHAAGLLTLDTFDGLDHVLRVHDRGVAYGNVDVHHNAFGNRLVAKLVGDALDKAEFRPDHIEAK